MFKSGGLKGASSGDTDDVDSAVGGSDAVSVLSPSPVRKKSKGYQGGDSVMNEEAVGQFDKVVFGGGVANANGQDINNAIALGGMSDDEEFPFGSNDDDEYLNQLTNM